jgi:hypothetical protein
MKLPTKPKPRETDFREFKFLIYGAPKSGKSTFASKFPDAIFIPTEPGLKFLECSTITDDDGNPKVVKNWKEIIEAVKLICTTEHQFKSVILDTVDNAWDFCSRHVLNERNVEHESDESFGKGYVMVKREFTALVNQLANHGFGLVFISHEKQSEKESRGVKFPYTDSSMGNSAKAYVNGLCDFIFYCYRDASGKRMMRTKATPNINAGDRSGVLPEVMPLDFDSLVTALQTNKVEKE